MLSNFGYLLDIAKRMYLKQPLNITKIKQLGSRKSGKTFSDIEFLGILLMLENINIFNCKIKKDTYIKIKLC
ncbi:hypothetical protein [Spiroplasma endosymbiont of Zeiraphera isertana]|uniref:hypothetical protein n=1 Tax=Spiroplasma endosymbiont of Zeiraphera isertana TaxID=3066313 RepID=UPI00313E81B3